MQLAEGRPHHDWAAATHLGLPDTGWPQSRHGRSSWLDADLHPRILGGALGATLIPLAPRPSLSSVVPSLSFLTSTCRSRSMASSYPGRSIGPRRHGRGGRCGLTRRCRITSWRRTGSSCSTRRCFMPSFGLVTIASRASCGCVWRSLVRPLRIVLVCGSSSRRLTVLTVGSRGQGRVLAGVAVR